MIEEPMLKRLKTPFAGRFESFEHGDRKNKIRKQLKGPPVSHWLFHD